MEWEVNRKGTQVHLTGVRPLDDATYWRYFYAIYEDGEVNHHRYYFWV